MHLTTRRQIRPWRRYKKIIKKLYRDRDNWGGERLVESRKLSGPESTIDGLPEHPIRRNYHEPFDYLEKA